MGVFGGKATDLTWATWLWLIWAGTSIQPTLALLPSRKLGRTTCLFAIQSFIVALPKTAVCGVHAGPFGFLQCVTSNASARSKCVADHKPKIAY